MKIVTSEWQRINKFVNIRETTINKRNSDQRCAVYWVQNPKFSFVPHFVIIYLITLKILVTPYRLGNHGWLSQSQLLLSSRVVGRSPVVSTKPSSPNRHSDLMSSFLALDKSLFIGPIAHMMLLFSS